MQVRKLASEKTACRTLVPGAPLNCDRDAAEKGARKKLNIVRQLEPDVPCCRVMGMLRVTVTVTLLARQGFEAPQWHQLLGDDVTTMASATLDLQRAAAHSDNLHAASAAMLLSQSGPCSALMLPVCPELFLEPAHFRLLLLRRLRLPLYCVPAPCQCGREQDTLGDHVCELVSCLASTGRPTRTGGSTQLS